MIKLFMIRFEMLLRSENSISDYLVVIDLVIYLKIR